MDKLLKNNPLVSVIIPCYNQGNFLLDAVNSVLDQTYTNWECIIVNDGSSDNTEDIAKSFTAKDPRIHYFFQANKGLPATRNVGIKMAKGQFIQLLDSDDIIRPNKLELQLKTFDESKNADIVYSEFLCFDNESPGKLYSFTNRYIISDNAIDDFIFKWPKELILSPHSFLFRKACFDNWGLFDESLRNGEDWDLYVRFSIHNAKFVFQEGVLALYRRHPDSICSDKNSEVLFSYKVKMMNKHRINPNLSLRHRRQVNYMLHDFIGKEAFDHLKNIKILKGIKKLISASYYSGKPFYYFYHGLYWLRQGLRTNP